LFYSYICETEGGGLLSDKNNMYAATQQIKVFCAATQQKLYLSINFNDLP